MSTLFPRSTTDLHFEEPAAFRRFSQSLVESALLTGVVIRLYRALVLANSDGGWVYWLVFGAVGIVFVCAMVTAHLANFTVRRWLWRAPAFAFIAWLGEMLTSAALIAIRREPAGSVRAQWADWPGMAGDAFLFRGLAICLWALLLAAGLWVARRVVRSRRGS